jgi:hypothetical protein
MEYYRGSEAERHGVARRLVQRPYMKKPASRRSGLSKLTPGSDLLSHTPTHAVPSAVAGLTSVFGMGTGVTLPL